MTVEQLEDNFENIPFEEQAKYGSIMSFFLTVVMLVRTPAHFFDKMHINKGVKLPLIFMLIILIFSNVMNYVYISADITKSPAEQIITAMENDPELKTRSEELKTRFLKELEPTDVLYSVFFNFILIYFIALFWHFILRSLKVALNGFEATLRVFSYSSVVLLTAIIPINNAMLNFAIYLWWAYLMFIGISEAHEISRKLAWRGVTVSLFATIIPFIFFVLALF